MEAFAHEAAKHMKTEKDLSDFSQMLTKIAVEAALYDELDEPLTMKSIKNHLHSTAVMATPPKQ